VVPSPRSKKRAEEMIAMETGTFPNVLYWTLWIIFLGIAYLLFFVISKYLMRRAVSQVVDRFKMNHSLCFENPKTTDELGLGPPSLYDRLTKPRDYKPYALELLIRTGVIRVTDEGKLCLLENKMHEVLR
jgi:hypothetical protein